jgi:hypothetical protein
MELGHCTMERVRRGCPGPRDCQHANNLLSPMDIPGVACATNWRDGERGTMPLGGQAVGPSEIGGTRSRTDARYPPPSDEAPR